MPRFRFWSTLLLALFFYACGGDGSVATSTVTPAVNAPTGSIDVQFQLLQRAVPTSVTDLRFSGLDAAGKYTFGPDTRPRTAQVLLSNVPTTTTTLRIEYLQNGTIVGLGDTPVVVPENGTVTVVDPAYQDVGQVVERIEVTPLAPQVPAGFSEPMQATAILFGGQKADVTSSVTWTSSNTSVATIGNGPGTYGVARGLQAGSTTLTATLAGLTDSTTLTVTGATLTALVVEPNAPVTGAGTTVQFKALGVFSDNSQEDLTRQVTWTSSLLAVATIASPDGLARALTTGASTITATEPGTGLADSTTLTVIAPDPIRLAIEPSSVTLIVGLSQQLQVVAQFADGSIQTVTSLASFSSSSGQVIVDSKGVVTGLLPGQGTTITATFGGLQATAPVTVVPPQVTSIAVQPASANVPRGLTAQFTATATLNNGDVIPATQFVTWATADPAVADISNVAGSEGTLTGLNFGSTSVTATLQGVQGQATANVTSASIVTLRVEPKTDTVPLGETSQLRAFGTFSDGTEQDVTSFVTWTSPDQNIAFVSNFFPENGMVIGTGLGTLDVTASYPGTNLTDFSTVTVTPAVLVSVSVEPNPLALFPTQPQRMRAIGTFSDGTTEDLSRRVWWSSNNVLVVAISNLPLVRGIALGLIPGQALIRADHAPSGLTGASSVTVGF